jgi:hypothetical protein
MGFGLVYEPRAVVEHAHAYDWAGVVRRYESRAGAERLMAVKHPWFRPHFRDQLVAAQCEPRSSRGWALVVDYIPRRTTRVHARVRRRADLHYLQKLAPAFLAAWDQASTARRD